MTVFTEGRHTAEFVVSEANGFRSRETVTVVSGQGKLEPGAVLGKITASGKYALTTVAAVDGSENAVAVLRTAVDATSADAEAVVIARDAEVNGAHLSYGADVDQPAEIAAKVAGLATVGIIVR